MINETVYQFIFDELSKYLVTDWKKLIVYLEYGKKYYSFSFYIKENNEYIKCYDLPYVSEKELAVSFDRIHKIMSEERKNEKCELWSNMTMIVTNDGRMHTDFDYTDISQGLFQFRKTWKSKYLI